MAAMRKYYGLGFVLVSMLLFTSLYLQFYDGFQPCPLCTLQRFAFVLLGVFYLIGLICYRWGFLRITSSVLALLSTIIGLALAGRQIWLQHFPSASGTECGVSLQYMLQALPINEVAQRIFQGTAECSTRGWEFLTLNMAEWSLVWFVIFFLLSAYLVKKR
jgi:disulfide bond formation protein DsbB